MSDGHLSTVNLLLTKHISDQSIRRDIELDRRFSSLSRNILYVRNLVGLAPIFQIGKLEHQLEAKCHKINATRHSIFTITNT